MLHRDPNSAFAAQIRCLMTLFAAWARWLSSLRDSPLQRWIGHALNAFLIVVFSAVVYQNRDVLPLLTQLLDPQFIGLCLGLYLLSYLTQALVWSDLMGYGRPERWVALEDYVRTTFMGWLPGGVWKVIGRMTVYRAPRLSASAILLINLVEFLLLLIANYVVLIVFNPLSFHLRLISVLVLLAELVILGIKISRFMPALQPRLRSLRWLIWSGGYAVAWLCGGAIVYLVLQPITAPAALEFSSVVTLWCVAGAVGLLLQIVPFSTFLRDLTLVALLQPVLSLQRAIIAGVAVRLTLMVCELIIGWGLVGSIRLVERWRRGEAVPGPPNQTESSAPNNPFR